MANITDLPEDILLDVLSLVPARELVRSCRLVCALWRHLADLGTVWKRKCRRERYGLNAPERNIHDWKTFYFLCSMKRNLIRNPCGEEGFGFWDPVQNERDEWRIEELPGVHKNHFPHQHVRKYFVTSQRPSVKSQLITLKGEGYWDQLMDETKPNIVVRDWYHTRFHCGCPCRYQVCVELLSENRRVLQEFRPKDVIVEQWTDGRWHEVSYTFHQYPPGVRHICFKHGGQGWYGLRLTNSSIVIDPETDGP
ncbi:F-box only protein 6-like [Elgaria multicarinata webbii]|uniref:F-box only protein 6-like n=1 Tax=Elgaria multicarinata webbii TaxID=159646 RepID=UPI002FCD084E